VSLELGGKSAAIVLDDADVGKTVAGLKTAGLMNNGQACVAQTRIVVSESRYDELVDALAEMMAGLHVGNPADETTDIGPLVSQRQQHRVRDYIRSGRAEGARIVVGGDDAPAERGWYVRPTLWISPIPLRGATAFPTRSSPNCAAANRFSGTSRPRASLVCPLTRSGGCSGWPPNTGTRCGCTATSTRSPPPRAR